MLVTFLIAVTIRVIEETQGRVYFDSQCGGSVHLPEDLATGVSSSCSHCVFSQEAESQMLVLFSHLLFCLYSACEGATHIQDVSPSGKTFPDIPRSVVIPNLVK